MCQIPKSVFLLAGQKLQGGIFTFYRIKMNIFLCIMTKLLSILGMGLTPTAHIFCTLATLIRTQIIRWGSNPTFRGVVCVFQESVFQRNYWSCEAAVAEGGEGRGRGGQMIQIHLGCHPATAPPRCNATSTLSQPPASSQHENRTQTLWNATWLVARPIFRLIQMNDEYDEFHVC